MSAIPFFLVTGFLGSGKTTFLKNIVNNNAEGKKIAIIQNEFAPANIDGADLKHLDKPFQILEINNGSVFCVCLLSDFISSLKAFIETENPDLVILESSGLSDPIAIAEILQSKQIKELVYLASCWCIIDVQNFHRIKSLLVRVKHQITIADYLIFNKIDLVKSPKLEKVKKDVRSINSKAYFMECSYCHIDPDIFYRAAGTIRIPGGKGGSVEQGCSRPPLNTGVFKTSRKIRLDNLKDIIHRYTDKTFRIKGYVLLENNEFASVQTVYNEAHINLIDDKTGNTALILMGEAFNLSEFSRDFRKLTG